MRILINIAFNITKKRIVSPSAPAPTTTKNADPELGSLEIGEILCLLLDF
jgi:hypothetical protein